VKFEFPVMLLDRHYDERFPRVRPPRPTPTGVTLNFEIVEGSGPYTGRGRLSITEGEASFFTDPKATRPAVQTPIVIENNELQGKVFYLLGEAAGAVTVQLKLEPAGGFVVDDPATDAAEVVMLTLNVSSYDPQPRLLIDRRKLVNGRMLGVPSQGAIALRSSVETLLCDAPQGMLVVLHQPQARCGASDNQWPEQGELDRAGQGLSNQDHQLWLYGRQAGDYFLGLGLHVSQNTVLLYGDCAHIVIVPQHAISVGFEYEVPGLKVEKRHDGRGMSLRETEWEGLPSKSKAWVSATGGLRLDTEVGAETYGEFVLGPYYDYAGLDVGLQQLEAFQSLFSRSPYTCEKILAAPIYKTNPGEEQQVFMGSGEKVTLVNRYKNWAGTCQATFAIPIWILPVFLANLDATNGPAAKAAAENAADHDENVDDAVMGMIASCEYYILCFTSPAYQSANDGPKTMAAVMFRTDFCSMYGSLTAAQQLAFQTWAQAHAPGVLLAGGYSVGGAPQAQGPQIVDWLTSIWNPNDGKDLLSPPPGFPRHHTNQRIPYAMGLLGLDPITGNVIAEFRAFGQANSLKAFARLVAGAAQNYLLSGQPGPILTGLED
jgi:hypothetical protein